MTLPKKPCIDCGWPFIPKRSFSIRCATCRFKRNSMITRMSQKVQKAIAAGRIPPISGQSCVDCGAKAMIYDHRDYSRPLDVVPVCVRCNALRGPAKQKLLTRKHPPLAPLKPEDLI